MSCLVEVDLICPKCGSPVVWCNSGDIIHDSSQFMATCPSCGYKDHEAKFPRAKERTEEERLQFHLKHLKKI